MAKTDAERKADQRKRDKKQGILQVNVKCHKSDVDDVKRYAKNKLDKRLNNT